MCGRYNIEFEDSKEIDEIIGQVDKKIKANAYPEGYRMKLGEIYPTNIAPILVKGKTEMSAELSTWGFPNFKNKGVVINARSETAFQKSMFRNSLLARRCVIPSTGFYEWDKDKKKYFIRRKEDPALYMAGIYNIYNDECRFVILTTKANDSMAVIHDRMPVILSKAELETWLYQDDKAQEIMEAWMPKLDLKPLEKPFEQMTLF